MGARPPAGPGAEWVRGGVHGQGPGAWPCPWQGPWVVSRAGSTGGFKNK